MRVKRSTERIGTRRGISMRRTSRQMLKSKIATGTKDMIILSVGGDNGAQKWFWPHWGKSQENPHVSNGSPRQPVSGKHGNNFATNVNSCGSVRNSTKSSASSMRWIAQPRPKRSPAKSKTWSAPFERSLRIRSKSTTRSIFRPYELLRRLFHSPLPRTA